MQHEHKEAVYAVQIQGLAKRFVRCVTAAGSKPSWHCRQACSHAVDEEKVALLFEQQL